jgi:3-deoxy-manno-octulosonate cytidylyltransferase (CMP-KDO synthetase)
MSGSDRVLGVIPARYDSTRFPGKPLAEILGRPMIEWVVEGVRESERIDDILVATDHNKIFETVEETEAEAVMTRSDHSSGSDRVAAAVADREAELIVNIQGDEPLIDGSTLDRGVRSMQENPEAAMGSFMAPLNDEEAEDPDVVKVVVDRNQFALYFSRSPVPYSRDTSPERYQHVGIYLFRREFLLEYSQMDPTPLEQAEGLEQLRALENGRKITMVEIDEPTVGVDRPEDVGTVEEILRQRGHEQS